MTTHPRIVPAAPKGHFQGASIEMTARDWPRLAGAGLAPSPVFIPWLPGEDASLRQRAAQVLHEAGHAPVPHLSARRIVSMAELEQSMSAYTELARVRRVLLIGGDATRPAGPFADSLSVIESGVFARHGIDTVGLAGHPEGNPAAGGADEIALLRTKIAALEAQGIAAEIVTQFSFDAASVANWLSRLRGANISVPVALGVAGPAKATTLLKYAARCGVGTSARVATRYGLSLSRLLTTAGPEGFLAELTGRIDDPRLRLHVFPFGGFVETALWLEAAS